MITLAAQPLVAQELTKVQVHAGMIDVWAFNDGERSLPLSEPTVVIEPAFDRDIKSYSVRMPYGVDGVTLVLEASRLDKIDIVSFKPAVKETQGFRYERSPYKGSVQTFPLQPGDNHLRMSVSNKWRGAAIYEFVITRPDELSTDTTLAALELGVGELSPAFDRNTRSYRTHIVGTDLKLTPTPSSGSVTVEGSAADGTALEVDDDLVSGLTAGENTIAIEVRAEDGTSGSYTLTAVASDDVREVTVGDVISQSDDCDADIGCDGTLNGVKGRFACLPGASTDLTNVQAGNLRIGRIQLSGAKVCMLSLRAGGVVDSASGWAFAAFP